MKPSRVAPLLLIALVVILAGCDRGEPAPEEEDGDEVSLEDDTNEDPGVPENQQPATPADIEERLRAEFFLPEDAEVAASSFQIDLGDGGRSINANFTTGLSPEELVEAYEAFFADEGWTTPEGDEDAAERASTTLRYERDGASGQMVINGRDEGARVALLLEQPAR